MRERIHSLLRFQPPINANRGLLLGSGPTVPSSADGWQVGALFLHTDGTAGTALYVNEGSITSSSFTAIVTAGYPTPITITPAVAGTFLDFELETEWVSGTLIRADFGTATTLTGSVVGVGLDFGTNIVVTSEQSVTGVAVTLPQMTISSATKTLLGLSVAVTGAIVTSGGSGTTTYRGIQIATPAITQGASTSALTHGVYVTGGAITSGTAVGIELAGAWTTGLIINTCTGSAITCIDAITISPNAAGTLLDFVLETEWVSGDLIVANFGGATTLSGATKGIVLDLGTNVGVGSEQNVTGVEVTLPQATNDASSPALKGLVIAASGAITATTSGNPTFMGVQVTTPAINCTADTIVSSGLDVTTGTITGAAAVSNGIAITGGAITSGTATGINMDGAWDVGITINGTVATGLAIDTCTTAAITVKDVITSAPEAAGTLLDFQLETQWVSGSMIVANFSGGTTFSSAVIGSDFDFGTNIVSSSQQNVTGYKITLPANANVASTLTLNGLEVAVTGAMDNSGAGVSTFNGVKIATPAITQTAGTTTSNGILITGGAITTGTATGLNLAGAWDSAIQVALAAQLFQLPASGTNPVAAGGTIGTHGTASLKIRIEIDSVEYFLIASTIPTFT